MVRIPKFLADKEDPPREEGGRKIRRPPGNFIMFEGLS